MNKFNIFDKLNKFIMRAVFYLHAKWDNYRRIHEIEKFYNGKLIKIILSYNTIVLNKQYNLIIIEINGI